MERKTLYLLRHGESVYNKEGIIQGDIDTPLSAKGKNDAKKFADKFLSFEIGHIASSSLKRAVQTAEFINEKLEVPLTIYNNLKEMHFGEWQAEMKVEHWADFRHEFYELGMAPPGGETKRELFERTRDELIKICGEVDADPILCVCHGMVIRVLIGEWFTNSTEKEIRALPSSNLALYKVEVQFDSMYIRPKKYKFIDIIKS